MILCVCVCVLLNPYIGLESLITNFMVAMFLFRNQEIEGQYLRTNGFEVEGQHSNNDGADSAERRMPRTILDPRRQFLQVYNKILLVSCVIAVSVDPLFFYIPIINDGKRCLVLDKRLRHIRITLGVWLYILSFHMCSHHLMICS